ncbi:histidine phosphatase family protein [Flavobacteriaceae bacterium]|nr:histidine phosphatase family protein [Flavobacteriaceae bacterium]MDA9276147.1 histidine phosphatase family protein [Flavobacteriaceae bacterium]MDA9850552.1 histidine phosphatase family protein [Flavobacteriaceae bacterium]MDC0559576.1 histidine phosphatase family protein [Flavobacteriaceae bacterium]MDC6461622.1 phosphoglycerate mutase family protein [Flavobacteriaceae bacterium]
MLKTLLLLTFLLGDVSLDTCSTFYLIRHAEKVRVDKSENNPALNEKGILRAQNWKNYFLDKEISKIYSTDYKRTIRTAQPLAINNNIETIIYSTSDFKFDDFIKSNIGENTLVVGHSNTIPDFVNELINEEYYTQIEDLNNSNLYIVSICDSKITHKLIKVN